MKYDYFKIFKFSTVSKKISRLKDGFPRIYKNIKDIAGNLGDLFISTIKYIFSRIYKGVKFVINNFSEIYKSINFPRIYKNIEDIAGNLGDLFISTIKYIFSRIYKGVKFVINNFSKIYKSINFRRYRLKIINYKSATIYFSTFFIFLGFVYVMIPMFFNYDKSNIEKVICKNQNFECSIEGKIYYSFLPTPRIKIKNLIISDLPEKKDILITVKHTAIKLFIKNLLIKEEHKFKKVLLNDFEINLNVKNLKKYKNILTKKISFFPIAFKNGRIIFFDGKNYIAAIDNANLNLKFIQDSINTILKGKFLNDVIYINLDIKKVDNKMLTNIILKMSKINFLAKVDFANLKKDESISNGNFFVKKNKNRIIGTFDYKDHELIINESNLKNYFLNGQLGGKINFLPYFNYNLDLSLNSINFTRLYDAFLGLDEKSRKNLFRINRKINGKINFSADKIYSKYNLVKSFESRIESYNGNISIEQFLINLGNLGAADILGVINNDKKFSHFKFESNIFVDNQKKFLSKFGIYNKKNIPSNLFISGNFDLDNIRISLYEISDDDKFSNEDIDYIEKEFNSIMLEEGYKNLFLFPKFKSLIKSITSGEN